MEKHSTSIITRDILIYFRRFNTYPSYRNGCMKIYCFKNNLRPTLVLESGSNDPIALVDLKLPDSAIIAMIIRNSKFITPKGQTIRHFNEVLLILTENRENFLVMYKYIGDK